ncbi:hypothetical protein [Marinobacter sp.]|uniref:hypothetical protein n=1 Tax=Marinobacter sp. TaxID=50741 RepID=UPI00384B09F6
MRKPYFYSLLLICSLFLTACSSEPRTPQEVAQAFWQSVIKGNAGEVVEHSTLLTEDGFDEYGQQWEGVTAALGRVVIEGGEASIVTTLEGLENSSGETVRTVTFLVTLDNQWLVDYHKTGDALEQRPPLDRFLGKLEDLGQQLRNQFLDHSDAAAVKLDAMAEELERLSDSANEQISTLMEDYGKKLQQTLDELARSMEEALEEKEKVSPEDSRILNEAVLRLDRQSEQLSEPDITSVAESSKTLARTQLEINRLGQEFSTQKERWRAKIGEISQEMAQIMYDASSS